MTISLWQYIVRAIGGAICTLTDCKPARVASVWQAVVIYAAQTREHKQRIGVHFDKYCTRCWYAFPRAESVPAITKARR